MLSASLKLNKLSDPLPSTRNFREAIFTITTCFEGAWAMADAASLIQFICRIGSRCYLEGDASRGLIDPMSLAMLLWKGNLSSCTASFQRRVNASESPYRMQSRDHIHLQMCPLSNISP